MTKSFEIFYGPYLFQIEIPENLVDSKTKSYLKKLSKVSEEEDGIFDNFRSFILRVERAEELFFNEEEFNELDLPPEYSIYLKEDDDVVEIVAENYLLKYIQVERKITLHVKIPVLLPMVLEDSIRSLVSRFVIEDGGLFLHSAGVLYNGAGFIFPGGENSGKTTLSNILKDEFTIISDERCILVPIKDRYFIFGAGYRRETTAGVEVSAILFHKKENALYFEPVNINESIRDLLKETFCYSCSDEILKNSLINAVEISSRISKFNFGFVNNHLTKDFFRGVVSNGI
jgi:hypothetical protein